MKKVKLKLKRSVANKLKIIGGVIVLLLVIYIFYCKQLGSITVLGYSKRAAKRILFNEEKEYILSVKDNKTLNAAFEREEYNEKYLRDYAKITYQDHKNLIKNINTLLDKGYSSSDVSMILSHGSDEDVSEFAKRERVKYLEEFYVYDYAKIKYYDKYVAYSYETGEDEKTTIIHVNLSMDKTEYDDAIEVTEFSVDMLVNKYHYLNEYFIPDDLMVIPEEYRGADEIKANRTALSALIQMIESAKVEGLQLIAASAYRSQAEQIEMAEYYRKWYGDNYVNNNIARPGFSEHQTGLAFDLGSKTVKTFTNSKEYTWVVENAYKFGFIARFSKKGEPLTGYKSEPGHFRYVGKDIAEYIYKNKITFEEYYVMFLDK